MKLYSNENVYHAACRRMEYIFDNFEKVCVSFSGGKDSGISLMLALQEAKKRNQKIGVLFIDLEGQYKLTIEYVERVLNDNAELIEPYWVCLPLNLRNAVSVYQPFWCCWEPGHEDKWIRQMPSHPAVISDQSYFPFWKYRMEFEEFVPEFAKWYADGKKTATIVGIRSDESLNRYRTIASKSKETIDGNQWTTRLFQDQDIYNVYPIYDWKTEDIWTAYGKFGWDYNRLYDMFYKAGVPLSNMRICQPYGDDQRIGLNLFRVIEPETWARVVNRVSGANFGNIYAGNKILGYRNVQLPKGHTWESYTKFLLASLPDEMRLNYIDRFRKFIKHWKEKGSGVPDELLPLLPEEAEIRPELSTRGNKNKRVVRYSSIPDTVDHKLESRRAAPTWRRMAICILKNDYLCKGLSFAQTKDQSERMKMLIEKYKNI
jgi:predicted phosphoadenosine phosphosulfate sulfurtransferase